MGLSLTARRLHVQLGAAGGHRPQPRTLFDIAELDLAAGQSLVLYGPSGSGKTTLLNLLGGLQHLPGAQIVWGSDEASAFAQTQDLMQLDSTARDRWRLQNAGLVFQQFQLFATMTVLDNVLSPYRLDHWRCPPQAQVRALSLLDQLGIDARARTGQLSRGEQQRVAIARTLVRQPKLVLADEPTASLDPATATQVMDILIEQCRQRQVTLVVATHDTTLAPRFDHAMRLHQHQLSSWVSP